MYRYVNTQPNNSQAWADSEVTEYVNQRLLFCDLQRYVYQEKRMILLTHLYVLSAPSILTTMRRENHVNRVRLIVLLRVQDNAARVIVSVRL